MGCARAARDAGLNARLKLIRDVSEVNAEKWSAYFLSTPIGGPTGAVPALFCAGFSTENGDKSYKRTSR